MSKPTDRGGDKGDEALRPHLSALVDGELEPLEAIALQRRVRQSPALESERGDLERLKLAVHMAGTRDKAPIGLETRLRAEVRAAFASEVSPARRRRLPLALGGVVVTVAAALLLLPLATGGGGAPGVGPDTGVGAVSVAKAEPEPSARVLARLVAVHRGEASPMSVTERRGAVVSIERLPDTFIADGQKSSLVQASYMGCNERTGGATLAVLDGARVDLPTAVDHALEMTGVFTDEIDGVAVKISSQRGRIYVLLSGDARAVTSDPI
jgi:hypothetical protein